MDRSGDYFVKQRNSDSERQKPHVLSNVDPSFECLCMCTCGCECECKCECKPWH